jgi:peptide chain release factor 1
MNLLERKKFFEQKKDELEKLLASPDLIQSQQKYRDVAKEHSGIARLLPLFESYEKCLAGIDANRRLLSEASDADPEFSALVQEDLKSLEVKKQILEKDIMQRLLPKEENEGRNIIVEIRAGTGGEEASLFASEVYRMYTRYADRCGLSLESLETSKSEMGGVREIIFSVRGEDAFAKFRYESGTHRVQRVPVTESSGRTHTSAITVAVLPEPSDVEIAIEPKDIRIDTFRSSGAGGQSVNTMDSAIRITHLPTKIVVSCQDERSQYKNKEKAMRILKARLLEKKQKEEMEKRARDRKSQVGSGDRSEKIRTYNFSQNRVTDHRINFTVHALADVLDGHIEDIVAELYKAEYEKMFPDMFQAPGNSQK